MMRRCRVLFTGAASSMSSVEVATAGPDVCDRSAAGCQQGWRRTQPVTPPAIAPRLSSKVSMRLTISSRTTCSANAVTAGDVRGILPVKVPNSTPHGRFPGDRVVPDVKVAFVVVDLRALAVLVSGGVDLHGVLPKHQWQKHRCPATRRRSRSKSELRVGAALCAPLGASGARLATTAVNQLRRSGRAPMHCAPCASASGRVSRWCSNEFRAARMRDTRGTVRRCLQVAAPSG